MTSNEVIPLFSSPICANTFELDDNEIESIKQERYKDIVSDISKYDGHISYDENIFQNYPKLKDVCHKHMDSFIYDVLKISRNAKFNIIKSWANLHKPNHSAHAHSHANSMFSGVLYLDTPKDSGAIRFYRGGDASYYIPKDSDYNDVIGTQIELTPEEKDVIIFMGWQKHSVLQNKSKEDRVSLSFNYGAIR